MYNPYKYKKSNKMGMLLSFLKNLIWIGYSLVESVMLTLAFNFLAPRVNEIYLATYTWKLPFTHVGYWHVFAFFIVIHYVGVFIQNLTPKFVNIQKSEEIKTS